MKKVTNIVVAVAVGFLLTISSVRAEDIQFSGFLGNKSVYDLLGPGPEGAAKLRWIKPGADLKKYNKFMVDSVIFFLADKAEYKGIDPQEMKDLADQFNKDLVAAFKGKYPLVSEPGPDVARIRFAITNIEASKPGISAITTIVPAGLGVSLVKKGATGGWVGSGDTGAEAMILDTMTNEIVAMVVDQQSATFTERFSKWGSANDAFKLWSEWCVKAIDNTRGPKQ
jgi:hypothetical protein